MSSTLCNWKAIKLVETVKNPGMVDRRKKGDWRVWPEIPAGTVCICREWSQQYDGSLVSKTKLSYTEILLANDRYADLHAIRYYHDKAIRERSEMRKESNAALASAVLRAGTEIAKDVSLWRIARGRYSGSLVELLQLMVDLGVLNLEGLDRMMNTIQKRWESEEA